MILLYPLGLLGLIGIPIIIAIYLIKNKYTEQVVPSTYLWNLSERFLKKKRKRNPLAGLISLILQLLIVTLVSFAIAHPMFVIPDGGGRYYFMLDASGSMLMEEEGVTRFEKGKEEVASLIRSTMNGSVYTLVLATDTSDVVYENLTDKERAIELLQDVSSSCITGNMVQVNERTQKVFDRYPDSKIYLVTDKNYPSTNNITVVSVATAGENYALTNVDRAITAGEGENGHIQVSGEVISYTSAADVTVKLFVDDGEQAVAEKKVHVGTPLKGEAFTLAHSELDYRSLRVVIEEEDCMPLDNQVILYNVKADNADPILIVSDKPFFLEQAFYSLGYTDVKTVAAKDYEKEDKKYGLYVFDTFVPETMPEGSAVWFVEPSKNITGSGFLVQDVITDKDEVVTAEYSRSTSTAVRNLLKNTKGTAVDIKDYAQISTYRNFTTLLSAESYPMIFAGANDLGNREVVFAFDLHVPFVLTVDFIVLMNNLIDYTFPTVLDELTYYCGETMSVNVLAGCDSIRIDVPGGDYAYLETDATVCDYFLGEVGVYTVTMTMNNQLTRVFNVYSCFPEEERVVTASAEAPLTISGTPVESHINGTYDLLLILMIAASVIFLADWMVYCYEQYQLR